MKYFLISFFVGIKDFKALLFSVQNFYKHVLFSKLQLTQVLEFCFTFFTNDRMTELRRKLCGFFLCFMPFLSYEVLKMNSLGSFRGELYIDFRTECVTMTLTSGAAITNDVLKFRKVIEFGSSCIVIYFFYIYLIVDGKRSFISYESRKKLAKLIKSKTLSTCFNDCQFVSCCTP